MKLILVFLLFCAAATFACETRVTSTQFTAQYQPLVGSRIAISNVAVNESSSVGTITVTHALGAKLSVVSSADMLRMDLEVGDTASGPSSGAVAAAVAFSALGAKSMIVASCILFSQHVLAACPGASAEIVLPTPCYQRFGNDEGGTIIEIMTGCGDDDDEASHAPTIETTSPVASPVSSPTPEAPVKTMPPTTVAPSLRGAPVEPIPKCTTEGADPYTSGEEISCCDGLEMELRDWQDSNVWFYRCIATPGSDGGDSDGASAKYRPLVLMHVMPWFTLKQQNSHWTMQLFEKDGLYLHDRYNSAGRIAAHYTPMTGPYESIDRVTIRLQLELMRIAGVDGVIVNWYGVSGRNDYPELLRAADTIVQEASAAGMLWTLCYEDRTISDNLSDAGKALQLSADWAYIRDEYIANYPGVVRDGGRPVFLNFGPDTLRATAFWTTMLIETFPVESERPFLLGTDMVNPDAILPDGDFSWPGWSLFNRGVTRDDAIREFHEAFYAKAHARGWYPVIGAAFPRFRDFYAEGSVGGTRQPWWGQHVQALDGATLRAGMGVANASGATIVQVATWNDWQEGTIVEPSAEEGFSQLLRLQYAVLGRTDELAMLTAVQAYNAIKAEECQFCDNLPVAERVDCGDVSSTITSCEADGCCWRETSEPGRPFCFHRSAAPVCTCNDALRNCTATPQDRLCCCKHADPLVLG